MMKENHKTKSSEYIITYQDELHIASTTLEEIFHIVQGKYKIKINPDVYLGSNFPHDLGGTMICLQKNLEKLYVNVNLLFKDKLPQDLQISFEIIKLLIKKGNLNLIHNKISYAHFNYSYLSRQKNWINYKMKCNHSIFLTHLN